MSLRWMAISGALLAAVGVGLGAFGAHGLEDGLRQWGRESTLAKRLAWFDTAVKYQLYHAFAVIIAVVLANSPTAPRALANSPPSAWFPAAGWLFLAGIVLFSGSLYAMTFGPDAWRKLGMVTPLGGLAFIAGWIALAVAAWRN